MLYRLFHCCASDGPNRRRERNKSVVPAALLASDGMDGIHPAIHRPLHPAVQHPSIPWHARMTWDRGRQQGGVLGALLMPSRPVRCRWIQAHVPTDFTGSATNTLPTSNS